MSRVSKMWPAGLLRSAKPFIATRVPAISLCTGVLGGGRRADKGAYCVLSNTCDVHLKSYCLLYIYCSNMCCVLFVTKQYCLMGCDLRASGINLETFRRQQFHATSRTHSKQYSIALRLRISDKISGICLLCPLFSSTLTSGTLNCAARGVCRLGCSLYGPGFES